MDRNFTVIAVAFLVVSGFAAAPTLANNHENRQGPQEERSFEANATGTATETDTGDVTNLEFHIDGNITVTDTEEGEDETASTQGDFLDGTVTIGDEEYNVSFTVQGEGTSLEQAGFVDDEAWNLYAFGIEDPRQGPPATFHGNLTLVGSDGEFQLTGDGTFTDPAGDETSTYHIEYQGEATFE